MILNLKELNTFVKYNHFELGSLYSATNMTTKKLLHGQYRSQGCLLLRKSGYTPSEVPKISVDKWFLYVHLSSLKVFWGA